MKRPSYKFAIQWIEDNDDCTGDGPEDLQGYLTVALVADLFGVGQEKVARDVINRRKRK